VQHRLGGKGRLGGSGRGNVVVVTEAARDRRGERGGDGTENASAVGADVRLCGAAGGVERCPSK
jgi:hypothetical protein